MKARLWQALDTLGHRIGLPDLLLRPLCDRFDLSLGITRAEISRTGPQICPHIAYSSLPVTCGCGCGGRVVQTVTS